MEMNENITYTIDCNNKEYQAVATAKNLLEDLYLNLTDEQLDYLDSNFHAFGTLEDASILSITIDMLDIILKLMSR